MLTFVDMSQNGLPSVLAGTSRVMAYLGFVLLIGTTFFLTWLWPEGRVRPTFRRMMTAGAVLVAISSIATPLLVVDDGWQSFAGLSGACALMRVALVALALGFGPDLLASARSHRLPITLWQLAVVETYVLSSDAWGGHWVTVKIVATTGHLFATAAWLGGLLALAAVLLPSTDLDPLHQVLPKFSLVAIASVITLVVSGTLHALAIAGGFQELVNSSYGTVLGIKLVVFGLMLVLGNVGRRYAEYVGQRKVADIDDTAPPESVQAFAVAIGAEFALAIGVLAATAALVHVVPVA